jgi:hypothetical protein
MANAMPGGASRHLFPDEIRVSKGVASASTSIAPKALIESTIVVTPRRRASLAFRGEGQGSRGQQAGLVWHRLFPCRFGGTLQRINPVPVAIFISDL